jgi:FAD:protein FMN transferase
MNIKLCRNSACSRSLIGIRLIISLCLMLISYRVSADERFTWLTGKTMGTDYSIKITDLPFPIDPINLQLEIDRLLESVNGLISIYRNDSELSRFNRNPSTDWVEVSSELITVIEEAQRISELSSGAFDVTVAPLVKLWGFGPDSPAPQVPPADQIQAAREKVGYRQIHTRRSPSALKKDRPDLSIDLSAIGEGYGVDRLAGFLEALEIHDYLVDTGGEHRVKGHSPGATSWRIGIERPGPGDRGLQRVIELESGAVATSGNYRHYFEQDGQRYSHLIDPHTGWPITHRLVSVTVIGQTAMRADALATALMVLGPEQG